MSNYDFPKTTVTIFAGTENERVVRLTFTQDDHIHAEFGHYSEDPQQPPIRLHSSEYTFSAHVHRDSAGRWDVGRNSGGSPTDFYLHKQGDYSAYPNIAPTHRKRILDEFLRAVNEAASEFASATKLAEEQHVGREIERREREIAEKQAEIEKLQAEIDTIKRGERERRVS